MDADTSQGVEKQLLDRILDGATVLPDNYYTMITVVLAPEDYKNQSQMTTSLLTAAQKALAPQGTLRLPNLTLELYDTLSSTFHDFEVTREEPSDAMVAKKLTATAPSVPLRRLTSKTDKKALWSTTAPGTPPIDAEGLLTEEDKARPVPTCEPGDGPVVRRKACKGCTCGLAEQLDAEAKSRVVVLGQDGATEVSAADRAGMSGSTAKITSSCGSCYLGDAFRCASCPYIGLPAFEPGQKVQIAVGMDDV